MKVFRKRSQSWHWCSLFPEFLPLLSRLFSFSPHWQLVQGNLYRVIYRWESPLGVLYIKHHRLRWGESLLNWLGVKKEKAESEWRKLFWLREKDLPVVTPVGFGVKLQKGWALESVFLSKEVPGQKLSQLREADEKWIGKALASFLKKLFHERVYHPDLHLENFLWNGEHLFALDFHAARELPFFPRLLQIFLLSKLFHSLLLRGRNTLFEQLLDLMELSSLEKAWLKTLVQWRERVRLKSRLKRIFRSSSQYRRCHQVFSLLYWRREYSKEEAKSLFSAKDYQVVESHPFGRARWLWKLCRWLCLMEVPHPKALAYQWSPWREKIAFEPLSVEPLPKPLPRDLEKELCEKLFRIHSHPYLGYRFFWEDWGLWRGKLALCSLERFQGKPSSLSRVEENLKKALSPWGYQYYKRLWERGNWICFHP